ncbi:MAG: type II toxin-antitoxin system HicB family antitoxin [Deferrisomatales bacterium]
MRYPVLIHKDPQSDYGVTVPDLPGCFSAGSALDEALEMAREAIECHLEGLILDGDPIPEKRPLEEHQANPEYAGAMWAIVEVDLAVLDDRAERVNITLPQRVLALIDAHARRHGESRSGFLARAAMEEMRRAHGCLCGFLPLDRTTVGRCTVRLPFRGSDATTAGRVQPAQELLDIIPGDAHHRVVRTLELRRVRPHHGLPLGLGHLGPAQSRP